MNPPQDIVTKEFVEQELKKLEYTPKTYKTIKKRPADRIELPKPQKKSNFRIQSKTWFLTYPKLDMEKQEFLDELRKKVERKSRELVKAVVCRELHEDGTPHMHAFLEMDKRYNCRDDKFWDVVGHHGNYQKCRNVYAAAKYIKKDGDILEYGDFKWAEKLDSKAQKRRERGLMMMKPKTTMKDILDEDPGLALQADRVQKALYACKQAMIEPYSAPDTRGVWIWGPPGVGKSMIVRHFEGEHLYEKTQNKWWENYAGQEAVLVDDFDQKGVHMSHKLKRWADRYALDDEVKGASVRLAHRVFYITSNYSIDRLFPTDGFNADPELNAALKRRFIEIHFKGIVDYPSVYAKLQKKRVRMDEHVRAVEDVLMEHAVELSRKEKEMMGIKEKNDN